MKKRIFSVLTAASLSLALLPAIPAQAAVTVPMLNTTDHTAYVSGYQDGTLQPQKNITRAEVATIFYRLLTSSAASQYKSTSNSFTDVPTSQWYNEAVSTMVNAKIITGYENKTFKPNSPITRAEFATIAVRFGSGLSTGDTTRLTDISGHWAKDAIQSASTAGWIMGYSNETFQPNNPINRAEVMTIINRMLNRDRNSVSCLANKNLHNWSDVKPGDWYYMTVVEATNAHTYSTADQAWQEIWTADADFAGATQKAAYAAVLQNLLAHCGTATQNDAIISGVSYARLLDFDGDGSDELLCAFTPQNGDFNFRYMIWTWDGSKAVMAGSYDGFEIANDVSAGFELGKNDGKWYISDGNGDADNNVYRVLTLESGKMVEKVKISGVNTDPNGYSIHLHDELTDKDLTEEEANKLRDSYFTVSEFINLNEMTASNPKAMASDLLAQLEK